MFNRNGDLEQKPVKKDDADAKSSESHGFDLGRTIKQAGDTLGKVQNDMIERVTNSHVKQQYVASISPALANQYVRGRDIMLSRSQSGKSTSDVSDLSAAEKQAVQTYQRLHSDLPSKIPFYNKETLANDLDRDIVRKARSQPEVRARAQADPGPEYMQASGPVSRQIPKQDIKQDTKVDARATAKAGSRTDYKGDSKGDVRADLKPDSKPDSKVDRNHSAILPNERKQNDRAQIEQRPVEQKSFPNGKAAETLVPDRPNHRTEASTNKTDETAKGTALGNALLTSLGKNKEDSEYRVSPQQIIQKPDAKPERKTEPNKSAGSHRTAADSHRWEEPKLLSPVLHSKAPTVRLIPISQSNIATAYRDGAINVVRQLSDRTAFSTIRIFVKPTDLISSKQEVKLEGLMTIKRVLPPELGHLSERDWAEGKRSRKHEPKIESKTSAAPSVTRSSTSELHPEAKAEPKAGVKSDFKAEHKAHLKTEDKADLKTAPNPGPSSDSRLQSKLELKPEPIAAPKPDIKLDTKTEPKSWSQTGSKSDYKPDSESAKPESSSRIKEPRVSNRFNLDAPQESIADGPRAMRGYRLKCQDADLKYITGPEIALSAIIALASVAKLRTDQSMWQTDSAALVQDYFESNTLSALNTIGASVESLISAKPDAAECIAENRKNANETSKGVLIRPKILIGANDSLVSIAEQLFNDAGIAWLILRLNKELQTLEMEGKTVVRIRSRQEIFIPVYQDIIDFQKIRTKDMSGSNLVTVVEENQIDREIVDMAIAPMLGHNSSNVDPLQCLQPLQIVLDDDT